MNGVDFNILWLILPAGCLVFGMLTACVVVWSQRRQAPSSRRMDTAPVGSFYVRLVAAFGGCKGIPWIGVSRNNVSPLLVLHHADVEYRVILRKRRRYGDIARVDARSLAGVISIILEFHGSWWSFTGNTDDSHLAAKAFHLLAEKGCPLSEHAQSLRG